MGDHAVRVALDATPLIGRPTGVGAFVRGLLSTISDRGEVEMQAYALTSRGLGDLMPLLPGNVVVPQRKSMPATPLSRLWTVSDLLKIERWVGDVDVVHGTNYVVPPSKHASRLVTVHDLTMLRFPELCTPATLRYPALIKRALKRGAHVHTPTAAIADEVVELLGAPAERVHVIHHGVSTPASAGETAPFMASGMQYVIAVGTLEPRKDFPALVRAFDLVADDRADVALVIVGGDGWGTAQLESAIGSSRHGDRMYRLGWVDDHRRHALIRGAAVLAFPSLYEGFGLPPLEAMQCDVPVVASDVPATREVVGDAALLFPVGEDVALAEALASVLDHDDVGGRLVAAGRERIKRFTWERCAEEFASLYELLGEERLS